MTDTRRKSKIDIQFTMNQTKPGPEVHQQMSLRSYSNYISCQKCGKSGYSDAEQKCNYASCIFFGICSLPWFIYKTLKKKDLNCYDSEHKCIYCGEAIASYKACEDF
jgi:hypothetical protein